MTLSLSPCAQGQHALEAADLAGDVLGGFLRAKDSPQHLEGDPGLAPLLVEKHPRPTSTRGCRSSAGRGGLHVPHSTLPSPAPTVWGCGDGRLGWQPLGEGVHAGEVKHVHRLAGLLHCPALRLVSVFDLLRGRAHGLAPTTAPQGSRQLAGTRAGARETAHLHCQVMAGATVLVLVQHLGDITAVKLVASQAGRLPLGREHSTSPPSPPGTPSGSWPAPQAWGRPCHSPWHGRRAAPGTATSPLPGTIVTSSPPRHTRQRGRGTGQVGGSGGGRGAMSPWDVGQGRGTRSLAAPIHPVLQGPAVLPPRCPLPTGRLHQVDAQLDKCPRGVFLGGEGDSPSAAGGDRAADVGPRACTVLQLVRRGGAEGPQPLAAPSISPAPGNNLSGTLQGGSQHG